MTAFDRWLEAPYTRAAADAADFERYCEQHDFDFDDPAARVAYEALQAENEAAYEALWDEWEAHQANSTDEDA